MERIPRPDEIYRHFKGNLYRVVALAQHTETDEMLVIYQALYGEYKIYARPLEMFVSEVDHEKYPDVPERFRFTLIPRVGGVTGAEASEPEKTAVLRESEAGNAAAQQAPAAAALREPEAGNAAALQAPEKTAAPSEPEAAPAPSEPEAAPEPEELTIDPALLRFLDADTYEQKLDILVSMHERINDDILNTLSAALEFELDEGDQEERYQALKNCLMTLKKYECTRLR